MNYQTIKVKSSQPMQESKSVLIIYTGGTMGMSYDQSGSLSPFNFGQIIDEMPELKLMGLELTVVSFIEPIDSSNVTIDHWNQLASIIETYYNRYHGFVILHGTDTLAYSSSALSFILEGLRKPVVFTGSQLPMGAIRSDARQNLVAALQIASSFSEKGPVVKEVCVYFNHILYRGNRCRKVESAHFDAFESDNYPALAEVGINIEYNFAALSTTSTEEHLKVHKLRPASIALIKLHPGLNPVCFKQILQTPGLQGVVMETFGSGNAPTGSWFIDPIKQAIANGIIIINVSQCNGGRVIQGRYATSKHLLEAGVLSGDDITTEAAISKMQFLFSNYPKIEEIRPLLTTSLRGETSY